MRTRHTKYIEDKTYILAFVGDGTIKMFETRFVNRISEIYGYFDCGLEVRIDGGLDDGCSNFFNVADKRLNKYVNCGLYVFSSKEKAGEFLPKIITNDLKHLKLKAEEIMDDYMKLADDCGLLENSLKLIKKNKIEVTNPFE